jgi:hypothetical protein
MHRQGDIEFLKEFRKKVDEYLFLGYAPSEGWPLGSPGLSEMDRALRNPDFQELRRKINEMKQRAHELLAECGVPNMINDFPAPLVGGPVLHFRLFDLIISNQSRHVLNKNRFLDRIDEAIGALREGLPQKQEVTHEGAKHSIFVGHSFAGEDSTVVEAVKKAIGILGINVVTGEKPSAQRISDKVKGRIADCNPIVVVMTRRKGIEGGGYDTSGWLIQEAAYALGIGRKIILMVESGVTNIGGLQGDLEQVRFDRNSLHDAILGLQELVKDAISRP